LPGCDSPDKAARYWTREFWFFSRQLSTLRSEGTVRFEPVPIGWKDVEPELLTGRLGDVDVSLGLLALSKMLCVGSIQPPWVYELSPDQIDNSHGMDMGYCNAFCLWIGSAFDDDVFLRKLLQSTGIPNDWRKWIEKQTQHR